MYTLGVLEGLSLEKLKLTHELLLELAERADLFAEMSLLDIVKLEGLLRQRARAVD